MEEKVLEFLGLFFRLFYEESFSFLIFNLEQMDKSIS
jgi:hypothetical protein